jgi:sugar lactone lactonase YvrE
MIVSCGTKTDQSTVSTFAGSGKMAIADGKGDQASFANLMGIAADNKGNFYVADSHNNVIRKITPDGTVTTLAGSGAVGSADGKGTAASFFYPTALAVDRNGNLYVSDTHNNLIRKIDPTGVVTTVAGKRRSSATEIDTSDVVRLDNPAGIAVDNSGDVYIADWGNDLIRKINVSGEITDVAGSKGDPGSKNGVGSSASFYLPWGLVLDSMNNVYVADSYNNMIRKISTDGTVTTVAGKKETGSTDGKDTSASFSHPAGLAIDKKGILYIADMGNNKIRNLSPGGVVGTVAGNGLRGSENGRAASASFSKPYGVAVANDGSVYVADYSNNLVRKITFSY